MKRFITGTIAFTVLSANMAAPVFADAIEDTIKARQAYYRLIGFNFVQLVSMVKGEIDYDAEAAKNAANNLKTISTLHIAPLYPAGSDNVAKKGLTRAKPNLWSDYEGVKAIGGKWRTAVGELQTVAGNGKGALAPAVGAVGEQCKACHDEYRAKDF